MEKDHFHHHMYGGQLNNQQQQAKDNNAPPPYTHNYSRPPPGLNHPLQQQQQYHPPNNIPPLYHSSSNSQNFFYPPHTPPPSNASPYHIPVNNNNVFTFSPHLPQNSEMQQEQANGSPYYSPNSMQDVYFTQQSASGPSGQGIYNRDFEMENLNSLLSPNATTFIPLNSNYSNLPCNSETFKQTSQQCKLPAKRTNSEPPKRSTPSRSTDVIEPLISNIIGSISNTYTHFGSGLTSVFSKESPAPPPPSLPPTSSAGGGHGGVLKNLANTPNPINKNSGSSSPIKEIYFQPPKNVNNNNNPAPPGNNNILLQGRASTPEGGTGSGGNSRPQTPKLSYLEVLTKNGANTSTNSSSSSAKSSSTPTPTPSLRKSSFSAVVSESSSNPTFRKSGDSFTLQNSSAQSSNSSNPSASSSPATRPKSSANSCQSGGKSNGKENSKPPGSSGKNTPSTTPVHQVSSNRNEDGGGHSKQNNGFSVVVKGRRKIVLSEQATGSVSTTHFDFEEFDEFENDTLDSSKGSTSTKGGSGSGRKADGKRLINGSAGNSSTTGSLEKEKKVCEKSLGGGGGGRSVKGGKGEKSRNRREGRNCIVRKIQILTNSSIGHLVSFMSWLWMLVTDVTTLSFSLGLTLCGDFCSWWTANAVPAFRMKLRRMWSKIGTHWGKLKSCTSYFKWRKKSGDENEKSGDRNSHSAMDDEASELLSLLGPEKNIILPIDKMSNVKRLLSVKGQDPYSVLGVKSNSSDETIRRYYKRQAVLVHPDKSGSIVGAEEAFKILAKAFEMIGEPAKRLEYHRQLLESQAKERVYGEIGNLLEQLRKKMESFSSTIRCTKCNSRHKKNKTDRPIFAARYCAQCKIYHSAREGDLWAEKSGFFGLSSQVFACMDSGVFEINEWARCQRKNLTHLQKDSHSIIYRLVAGANQQNQQPGGDFDPGEEESLDPDDWDSLINNIGGSNGIPKSGGNVFGGVPNPGTCSASASSSSSRKRRGKNKK